MTIESDGGSGAGLRALARAARAVIGATWREIASATEWLSHGGRVRPHTAEGSAWDDYTWGMGPPDPIADEDRAEHGLIPRE